MHTSLNWCNQIKRNHTVCCVCWGDFPSLWLFVKSASGVSQENKTALKKINNKEQAFHSSDHTRQTHIPARDICRRLLNFVAADPACQNFGEEFLSSWRAEELTFFSFFFSDTEGVKVKPSGYRLTEDRVRQTVKMGSWPLFVCFKR